MMRHILTTEDRKRGAATLHRKGLAHKLTKEELARGGRNSRGDHMPPERVKELARKASLAAKVKRLQKEAGPDAIAQ